MTLNFFEDDSLPKNWSLISLSEIRRQKSQSFNPAKEPDKTLELYSVPSHEFRTPEIINSVDIGSNKQYVETGDILISKINPRLNRVWVVGNKTSFDKIASTEWIVFSKNDCILSDFLSYLLQSFQIRDYLAHNASGVGGSLMRVKPSLADTISIGLPPLNEQKRIVAKIEELFTELETAVASLQLAQAQLKTYRQALLKHAFEGKLTAQWRADNPDKLEDAQTLLQRIKAERQARYEAELAAWEANGKQGKKPRPPQDLPPLTPAELNELPQLPAGWAWAKAEEISEFITKGTTPKKDDLFPNEGDIPFIKVYNLTHNGSLDFTINPTFVSKDTHEGFLARSKVFPGDVLMNIVGPPLGKVSIVPSQYPEWNINQAIARFRSQFISRKFLSSYLLFEGTIRSMMSKSKATAGQFNLTLEICREIPVPICSITEQSEIVMEIESRLSVVDQLEKTISDGLQQAEALRQSILKKAFAGQLVPQDPQDEPASVLLARIRAAKS